MKLIERDPHDAVILLSQLGLKREVECWRIENGISDALHPMVPMPANHDLTVISREISVAVRDIQTPF